jgi:hypothetical protein
MRCPTCGSVCPKDPEQKFWWSCWPCPLCPRYVCNQAVFTGKSKDGLRESTVCYVKHQCEKHPEVYEVKK